MNVKRVAALLRELADAIEADAEPVKKPKRKAAVVAPTVEVSPRAEAGARRALRRAGVAA